MCYWLQPLWKWLKREAERIHSASSSTYWPSKSILSPNQPWTHYNFRKQFKPCGTGASNGHAKDITSLTLRSTHDKTFQITIEALVMARITNLLPSNTFKPQFWEHIIDLSLADPPYHRTGRNELILHADLLAQIIMNGERIGPAGSLIRHTLAGFFRENFRTHRHETSLSRLYTQRPASDREFFYRSNQSMIQIHCPPENIGASNFSSTLIDETKTVASKLVPLFFFCTIHQSVDRETLR